jgi:pimeloyl-ACP methyl ester carboxylesterase
MMNDEVSSQIRAASTSSFIVHRSSFLLFLLCAGVVTGQSRPAELPRAELETLYRSELRERFDPAKFDQFLSAHRLLEEYFAARSSSARRAVVSKLEASGIDVPTLARMCRIRLAWPELPPGAYYVNEKIGPHNVAYFLGVPEGYTRAKSWPLVVRLPPAEPFLTQPPPDQTAVAAQYRAWIEQELKQHPDALLLMPLLNLNTLFGPSYSGTNSVMQPIFHVVERANIDPSRLYVVGHSMGAHAVWNLGLHYPTYFSAICPLAGSAKAEFQRLRLRNLRNTLPVFWHDANDEVITVDMSRQLARALRGLKIDIDYEETRKLGHRPPASILEKTYDKMRKRQRALYPSEVLVQSDRPDAIYNRVDWLQIDMPSRPGDEKRMYFSLGKEHFVVHENPWSARARLTAPNRIEITSDNVELLRVFLSDEMIDFAQPIGVVVNTKPRFEGFVKPDLKTMLNDQLFLGRGWRNFSAAVELDLAPPASTRPARGAASE